MQLNETAFLKASKRLAKEDSTPLSAGQEKLSRIFGFKNFDAAQKSLKKLPGDPIGSVSAEVKTSHFRHWRGLNGHETSQFLQSMFDISGVHPSDPWVIKSRQLSTILVGEFFSRQGPREVAITDLIRAAELDSILERCTDLNGKSHLLPSQKRFLNCVTGIPGYSGSSARGNTVFAEQWSFLSSAHKMALISLEVADSIEETSPVWSRLKNLCLSKDKADSQNEEISSIMRLTEQSLSEQDA